jgi:hypothetical protein
MPETGPDRAIIAPAPHHTLILVKNSRRSSANVSRISYIQKKRPERHVGDGASTAAGGCLFAAFYFVNRDEAHNTCSFQINGSLAARN